MPGGRPTKLTPELKADILQLIGDGGLTYTDACRCVGLAETTFYKWKQRGQETGRGLYWEFIQELEGAEARFRQVHLGKIRDAALNVSVEKRTVIRRKAIVNEAGETVPAPDSELYTEQTTTERPPDAKLSQWLLERKWPELYSRKHIEVSATVKSEDPSPPMRLIVIDQLETPPVPVGENEKGPEPDAPAPEADTPGLAGEDDD